MDSDVSLTLFYILAILGMPNISWTFISSVITELFSFFHIPLYISKIIIKKFANAVINFTICTMKPQVWKHCFLWTLFFSNFFKYFGIKAYI